MGCHVGHSYGPFSTKECNGIIDIQRPRRIHQSGGIEDSEAQTRLQTADGASHKGNAKFDH
jgi:hypothetical protein